MRRFLVCTILLSALAAVPAFASQTTAAGVAPADEYFGRYSESVLEIRNRLERFEAKSDAEVAVPGTVEGLDNLADAVMAWQHKYPADPWVVAAMSRLIKCYARMGFASSPHATSILGSLVSLYPNSSETAEALLTAGKALVPEPASAVASVANDATFSGSVVDATTGSPVEGAIVFVAPDKESTDVTASPFATTGNDGTFAVKDVPVGSAYKAGFTQLAHADFIVVQPPRGSAYAPYHGVVDASGDPVAAGVIRLSSEQPPTTAVTLK